jgi:hypothetical protein
MLGAPLTRLSLRLHHFVDGLAKKGPERHCGNYDRSDYVTDEYILSRGHTSDRVACLIFNDGYEQRAPGAARGMSTAGARERIEGAHADPTSFLMAGAASA